MYHVTDPCFEGCADCAFDTHVEPGWDFIGAAYVRGYFAARRRRLNPWRAVPFLSDLQRREIFETVATLDVL